MRTAVLRRTLLPAATIMTALLLTACGSGAEHAATGTPHKPATAAPATDSADATASGSFNDADVTLVTGMIPHHQQAVEMAELAETRAANAEVKTLAAKVKAAQGPEITQMTQMLKTWGKPVPSADAHGGGHDSKSMPGMMSDDDMKELKAASGAAFDKMFLDMMVAHHEGAVEMAEEQLQAGADPAVKALADAVVTTQTAEIAEMKQMLSQL